MTTTTTTNKDKDKQQKALQADGDALLENLEQAMQKSTQKIKPNKKYPVMEIFGPTIQGEGIATGSQVHFLRMGGCDYRCKRCDSLHAVLPELIKENSMMLTQHDIYEALMRDGSLRRLVISGGNPLMWDLDELVSKLRMAEVEIHIETQGTIWREWLTKCHIITVSPKGPGMGEEFEPDKYRSFMQHCYAHDLPAILKVVIFSSQDIEFLVELLTTFPSYFHTAVYASIGNVNPPEPAQRDAKVPVSLAAFRNITLDNYRELTEEILNDPRECLKQVRILPQIHTLIWGNEKGR